jgi:hypothetical protein
MSNSENDKHDVSRWLSTEHSDETTSLQPFTITKKKKKDTGNHYFFFFLKIAMLKKQLIKEKKKVQ